MPKGYTFDSGNGPGVGMSSAGSSGSGSSSTSSGSNFNSARNSVNSLAQSISALASTGTSTLANKIRESLSNPASSARSANVYDSYVNDFGLGFDMDEYYDRLLDLAQYNNDWSAMQAQKQMDYQTRSDQAAMAWSASEADRSRKWTENLSNTAHQREVKDLLAAGLNPVLSANNGAWSGSGATGQGFSSSGAMGETDMSIGSNLMSMVSGMMTTARDLAMTKMSTDASKYASDRQFAASKMAAETSIFNNNNNIDANKAINALNRDADIRKTSISADATRAAAAANAGAITSAAATNASAARYSADQHLKASETSAEAAKYGYNMGNINESIKANASKYVADKNYEASIHRDNSNIWNNPVGYGEQAALSNFGEAIFDVFDAMLGLGEYSPYGFK